jgi:hypothetical protein
MTTPSLTVNGALLGSSRFPFLVQAGPRAAVRDWAVLLVLGAGAALATVLVADRQLVRGLPGHAILRGLLPLALGLALVPRRFSGSVMGGSALLTTLALRGSGVGLPGIPALTALVLTGPLLDLSLWHARPGWRLYLRMALAGLLCNGIALGVHLARPWLSLPPGGSGGANWPLALLTYPLFGLLAGLLSAFCWFRLRGQPTDTSPERQRRDGPVAGAPGLWEDGRPTESQP